MVDLFKIIKIIRNNVKKEKNMREIDKLLRKLLKIREKWGE